MRSGFLALLVALVCAVPAIGQGILAPYFLTHPGTVSVYSGEQATLSGTVVGTEPITYQWRRDGVVVAGATNATLTVTAAVLSTTATIESALYTLTATNAAGSVTSIPGVILVNSVVPKRVQTITFAAPTSVVAAGTGVTLTATASSNLPVSFTLISGAGSLSGNVVNGLGGNVVVRASQAGNTTYAAAESVERTITFVAGVLSPFITVTPSDQTALAGTRVSLAATAIGTPIPTYQWQKDGVAIAGATAPELVFASLKLTDAGRYTVAASNLAGSVSASAQITVRAAPVVTTPPASQTVTAGTAATFTVETAAFPAPTFQWRKDGRAIAGATRSTYAIALVTTASAGNYDVVVTNALGAVTSSPATLAVTTRDFSGTYLGKFSDPAGDAVLVVRANGTASFFGHLPSLGAGIAELAVTVDLSGNFSATVPLIAATARNLTLRGTIDEVAGTTTGSLAETGTRFELTRATPAATLAVSPGIYTAALVNSASGRGYVVIAPDGQAFLLTAAGTTVDAVRTTLTAAGRLTATTATQTAVDLAFTNGTLRGTVRTAGPGATTGTISGAIEGIAGTEHLANLSVRAVATPLAPMITGFAIGGTTAKQVLIRAAGPALNRAPFNLGTGLPDPTIQLFRVSTLIGQNNDWGTPAAGAAAITTATSRAGAFPFANGSADAALLTTLQPGVYTVQIGGGTGVVLAEVYEVSENNEAPGARRLVNTSTLGAVAPDFPLIAGFVITGTAPQRVLIRGAGPTLAGAPFNVAGVLANPQITLYRGATVVRTNDDWFRDPEAAVIRDAASRVRAFAFGNQSLDAAILAYLEPGAYTAVLTGPANVAADVATGVALVEIYESTP